MLLVAFLMFRNFLIRLVDYQNYKDNMELIISIIMLLATVGAIFLAWRNLKKIQEQIELQKVAHKESMQKIQEQIELQKEESKQNAIARAWEIVGRKASGNSGKIEALEFLVKVGSVKENAFVLKSKIDEQQSKEIWKILNEERILEDNGVIIKSKLEIEALNLGPGLDRYRDHVLNILKHSLDQKIPLVGIDLSTKTHGGSVWLTGVNLTGANLTGTELMGATLREAKFLHAILEKTNFTEADLRGSDFSKTEFIEGAIFPSGDKLNNVKFGNHGVKFNPNPFKEKGFYEVLGYGKNSVLKLGKASNGDEFEFASYKPQSNRSWERAMEPKMKVFIKGDEYVVDINSNVKHSSDKGLEWQYNKLLIYEPKGPQIDLNDFDVKGKGFISQKAIECLTKNYEKFDCFFKICLENDALMECDYHGSKIYYINQDVLNKMENKFREDLEEYYSSPTINIERYADVDNKTNPPSQSKPA